VASRVWLAFLDFEPWPRAGIYVRVKAEKEDNGRLPDCELLFPNVELRLGIRTKKGNFVNIHLLASSEDADHVKELNRFLSKLSFAAYNGHPQR
jgi:hypothetical protein